MKLCVLSDTHNNFNFDIPASDILIHAGDFDALNNISELLSFVSWFRQFKANHKIVIAGNHDGYIAKYNNITRLVFHENNIIYLENSVCEVEGLKIYGSPMTPEFNNWYFMAERGEQMKRYWDMIPNGIDILITHGPPLGILDYTPYHKEKTDNEHAGCEELLKAVNRIKPRYHIFGHIHGSNGIFRDNSTLFINASVLDEEYKLRFEPKIINV